MSQVVYPRAPIAEAVLDIRVRLPQQVDLTTLEQVKDKAYPSLQRPIQFQFRIEPQIEAAPSITHEVNMTGFVYTSADGKQVVQFRKDGFSFARLKPYLTWNDLAAEARRLWQQYKSRAVPEFIELLGLNYVNHLEMPLGEKFEDYFKTYIEVPKELPQVLNAFSFAFQVADSEYDAVIHVSQTYGPFSQEGKVTLIMNVQAYRELHLPASEVTEDAIWSTFEQLREAKNKAFESCITEKMREVFR